MENKEKEKLLSFCEAKNEEEMLNALNNLKKEYREILELRYGLNGKKVTKPSDLAIIYGEVPSKIYSTLGNAKNSLKKALNKYSIQKENKYDGNRIVETRDRFKMAFPNDSKEDVLWALNELSNKTRIKSKTINMFVNFFNLDNSGYKNLTELAKELNIKNNSVSQQIYTMKKKIEELLTEKQEAFCFDNDNFLEDLSEDIVDNNVSFENMYTLDEVINMIKNNNLHDYNFDNVKITVTLADCILASVNLKKEKIEKANTITKKCYVYRIEITDENGFVMEKQTMLKDRYTDKFYNVITKNDDGEYDFSSVKNTKKTKNICFEIKNEEKLDLEENYDNDKSKLKNTLNSQIEILYRYACECFEKEDYEACEQSFRKILNLSDDVRICYKANISLGKIYLNQRNATLAEKHFKDALEIENDYDIRINLCDCLIMKKKYNEALICLDECEKISNGRVKHILRRNNVLIYLNRLDEALELIENAIEKSPDNYFLYLYKSYVFLSMKKYDLALEQVRKCDSIKPYFLNHKILNGKIEYELGNEEESTKIFDHCLSVAKNRNQIDRYASIIGRYFHEKGNEKLTYKYYNQTQRFLDVCSYDKESLKRHFEKHKQKNPDKKIHSVLNVDLTLPEVERLINEMDKTRVIGYYDEYIIYWPGIGKETIDGKISDDIDHLLICTKPFTKEIIWCYPVKEIEDDFISIDELRKKIDNKNTKEFTDNKEIEVFENKKYKDDEDEAPKIYKDGEVEASFIPKEIDFPSINEFSKNKDTFRTLINLLPNPTEQVVLLLSLGYVEDKYYTLEEVSRALCMKKQKVEGILNQALSNIASLSIVTINCVESARKKLSLG